MTILLVEDNERMRAVIRKILERQLKDVEQIYECNDGIEAIDLYKRFKPDWMLIDIRLKKLDGLNAARMIIEIDKEAKIIIITQYDDPEYQEASKRIGAIAIVLKENILDVPKIIIENSII